MRDNLRLPYLLATLWTLVLVLSLILLSGSIHSISPISMILLVISMGNWIWVINEG